MITWMCLCKNSQYNLTNPTQTFCICIWTTGWEIFYTLYMKQYSGTLHLLACVRVSQPQLDSCPPTYQTGLHPSARNHFNNCYPWFEIIWLGGPPPSTPSQFWHFLKLKSGNVMTQKRACGYFSHTHPNMLCDNCSSVKVWCRHLAGRWTDMYLDVKWVGEPD